MTSHVSIKKTFLTVCCMFAISAGVFAGSGPDLTISEKMLQAFKKTFPDAQEVKWAEQQDSYTVNFKQGDILTKVEYDKDGNFLSSLRYYSEKNLPVSVLCRLQKRYADKKIFGVTELATDNSVEYYVKMEDADNWITVRSNAEGNMQVVEKYKKAS
jgi:hypothetical protein